MWRLRVAAEAGGGGDNPWLRTKNAHVGRQVWEFDAAADFDPAVDAARRAFVDGRRHVKHSADLLMRIQEIIGVFNKNCMISCSQYRNIFPIWGGEYRCRVLLGAAKHY